MKAPYHVQLTTDTLSQYFGDRALKTIVDANLGQDRLAGQIGHPEFHFDDSQFDKGNAYIEAQREIILSTLEDLSLPDAASPSQPYDHPCSLAWQAFGRLTHAAQDFYAHSNYAALWREAAQDARLRSPAPEEIDPLDPSILYSPELHSGRALLIEVLVYIPLLGPLVKRLLPRDTHAWMNLDHPGQGDLFPYALDAARKRTRWEYETLAERISQVLGSEALSIFQGLNR